MKTELGDHHGQQPALLCSHPHSSSSHLQCQKSNSLLAARMTRPSKWDYCKTQRAHLLTASQQLPATGTPAHPLRSLGSAAVTVPSWTSSRLCSLGACLDKIFCLVDVRSMKPSDRRSVGENRFSRPELRHHQPPRKNLGTTFSAPGVSAAQIDDPAGGDTGQHCPPVVIWYRVRSHHHTLHLHKEPRLLQALLGAHCKGKGRDNDCT